MPCYSREAQWELAGVLSRCSCGVGPCIVIAVSCVPDILGVELGWGVVDGQGNMGKRLWGVWKVKKWPFLLGVLFI